MHIRIGTRGSKLALVQAQMVRERIEERYKEHDCELVVIKTKGDRIQDKPLKQIGDKGLFVKEIEEQLLEGSIDLAVHSMKDMPSRPAEGLSFSKAWRREDPRDVLILREADSLSGLRKNAVIGTGSARRALQLKKLRPDLMIVDIRGNVDTRIRKMKEQKLDGLVLAAAGLKRLGREAEITCYLSVEEMIPAPAQGILALEYATERRDIQELLDDLCDEETDETGKAERLFLEEIGGDCHTPVGAICGQLDTEEGRKLHMRTVYGTRECTDYDKLYFADVLAENPKEAAILAAAQIRKQMAGKVYLVSAGPGESGLFTLRGREVLEQADCVIYDRLIEPELLGYAKHCQEFIYVGKENHHHTFPQEKINCMLAEKAMKYQNVVRLKGGDAYVFGRGGEEALYLRSRGVEVSVVPGITSATAALCCAGIPITHRGISTGFHVMTAHNRKDELAEINFGALAKSQETLVFLMGLGKLQEIMDELMRAGMAKDMPAAVIASGTTASQQTVVSDIEHLTEEVIKAKLSSPAIIVVGKVVSLRRELNFFEERPLFGRKFLVTKIGREVSGLTMLLREQGAYVKEVMTGEIVKKEFVFGHEELKNADWLIFTSVHGVDSFFESFLGNGFDVRTLGRCKIGAVGPKTAGRLKNYGILADVVPKTYHGQELEKELKRSGLEEYMNVWHFCGVGKSEILEGSCKYHPVYVYENRPSNLIKEKLSDLTDYEKVFFTCGSSAERLFLSAGDKLRDMCCVSIGEKCSETLRKLGAKRILQAKRAVYESMYEAAFME